MSELTASPIEKKVPREANRTEWELLHHGRRVGKEERTEIRMVSEETTLIPHIEIEIDQL